MELGRSALILVDFQNDWLHPDGLLHRAGLIALSEDQRRVLVESARTLVHAFRAAGKPVIWANTVLSNRHLDSALPPLFWARLGTLADNGGFVRGSWGAMLADGLSVSEEDFVVDKKGLNAFQFTHLDRLLSTLGVEVCVPIGGGVSGALADSVRHGGALGYEMVIPVDVTYPPDSPLLDILANRAQLTTRQAVLAGLATTRATGPTPRGIALLIVDIQNDFVHPRGFSARKKYSSLTDEDRELFLRNTRRLVKAAREQQMPVIFITTIHRRDMLDSAPPRSESNPKSVMPGDDYLVEGTWGAQVVDGLDPQDGELVIVKKARSGFAFTPLHRTLRNLAVGRCIVTGGAIHGCLEDTVRDGAGLGYELTVAVDATYSPNASDAVVMSEHANIETTDDILASFDA